jgi:cell division FtsZ-interacting protein ZapD
MIISTPTKTIKYISACYQGKCHDYQLLKIELPLEKHFFKNVFTAR